jgi:hypothetical protein
LRDLDSDALATLVTQASHVEVVPSMQCAVYAEEFSGKLSRANIEVMLTAAKLNVPTNTVYNGRQGFGMTLLDVLRAPSKAAAMKVALREAYCRREIETAKSSTAPGELIVLLSDEPRADELAPGVACSPLSWALACRATRD